MIFVLQRNIPPPPYLSFAVRVSGSDSIQISGRCVEFVQQLTQGVTVARIEKQPYWGAVPLPWERADQ